MRAITTKANHAKRTFTLRISYTNGAKTKYRTLPMGKHEFNNCLHNTEQDWSNFLKSDEYYKVS